MTLLKIARMGHPVLLRRAEPVADPTARDIRRLVEDMIETMADAQGVGLAAPQVHVSRRVIVFMAPAERMADGGESEAVPMTALVNPGFEPLGEHRALGREGCLSIPGMTGEVPRYTAIRYRGLTTAGQPVEREAFGFHARVVQHEIDHLDGILYTMRMDDLSTLAFNEELQRTLEAESEDE